MQIVQKLSDKNIVDFMMYLRLDNKLINRNCE